MKLFIRTTITTNDDFFFHSSEFFCSLFHSQKMKEKWEFSTLMKLFSLGSNKFNGILKYADKLSDVEYQIPDNCASSSDPVENLVKNPLKSSIILNYNSGITDPSYIIFCAYIWFVL